MAANNVNAHLDRGVRAQSFGGAYRAVSSSNDILFYNPAGILKKPRIEVDSDYSFALDEPLHNLSLSLIDSRTTSWGLGLLYNSQFHPKTELLSSHLFHFTVAMPIVTNMLTLGTTFSYNYDRNKENDPYRHFFNIDAALMATLPIGLSFAIVADHIINPKGQEKSLGLALASAFDLGALMEAVPFTLSFDWLMDDVKSKESLKHVISAGAEYVLFNVMPLRVGIKSESASGDNLISLGTGLIISNFAVDGLYQQHLSIGKIRHFGMGLRFFF